jgi:AraC-like DNA-binding protein
METSSSYPKAYLYRRLVNAKLFIDRHYHEQINLDNISGEACFSKYHFIRSFKNIYGKTPHQYLTTIRIEKACELLKKGKTVTDACYEVGFESLSSFTSLFREYCNQPPSGYRVSQQQIARLSKEKPFHFIPGCYTKRHGWIKKSNFQEAEI